LHHHGCATADGHAADHGAAGIAADRMLQSHGTYYSRVRRATLALVCGARSTGLSL
jgi:hypothetical protein